MNPTPAFPTSHLSRFGPLLPPRRFAGFAAAIVSVLLIALFGYRSLDAADESTDLTTYTFQVMQRVDTLMSSLKDAETGQRGRGSVDLLLTLEQLQELFASYRAGG